jgi:hypothetical protein
MKVLEMMLYEFKPLYGHVKCTIHVHPTLSTLIIVAIDTTTNCINFNMKHSCHHKHCSVILSPYHIHSAFTLNT